MISLSSIFSFLGESEPTIKSATTVYGIIKNYQRDKKIESVEKDVSKIKSILGLKEINLTEDELKVVSLFINKSMKSTDSIDSIYLSHAYLKKLQLVDDIDDILLNLESYKFINVKLITSDSSLYNLKYEIFISSNLIKSIFSNSITYSELFRLVVNHIYENHRKEDIIYTKQLIEELTLSDFLLNPILYHLNSIDVIEIKQTYPSTNLIANYSLLIKSNLYKLYRELNEDKE